MKAQLPPGGGTHPQRCAESRSGEATGLVDVAGSVGQQCDSGSEFGDRKLVSIYGSEIGGRGKFPKNFQSVVSAARAAEFFEIRMEQLVQSLGIMSRFVQMQFPLQLTQLR